MEDGDSLYARIAELEKQLEAEKSDDMCEEAYREGRKKRNDVTFLYSVSNFMSCLMLMSKSDFPKRGRRSIRCELPLLPFLLSSSPSSDH